MREIEVGDIVCVLFNQQEPLYDCTVLQKPGEDAYWHMEYEAYDENKFHKIIVYVSNFAFIRLLKKKKGDKK